MRIRSAFLAAVLLCLVALAPRAMAQSGGAFDLTWNLIAAGGGAHSTGGSFDASGGMGQPSVRRSDGGTFTLLGGFWNVSPSGNVDVPEPSGTTVFSFGMLPPRPNPLVASTTLEFELARPVATRLTIYDVSGQSVRALINSRLDAGRQRVVWDGRNAAQQRVASGIYFARLEAGEFHAMSRLVVLH